MLTHELIFVLLHVTDRDECAVDNGLCSDTCSNTVGSFVCSCPDGLQLANPGLYCSGTKYVKTVATYHKDSMITIIGATFTLN